MKTTMFVFRSELRESLNKVLPGMGIMPFGEDDRVRETWLGTIRLTDYMPEDIKEGFSFEYEDKP